MGKPQGIPDDISRDVYKELSTHFSDPCLFNRALTHRSYLNEHPEALEDNERLEFLGDAVLDFLVGAWLYNRFPEMKEGSLTRLRAALVGNEKLADFAREIGLGGIMRLGRGEAESGGRLRSALLGSTFEAIIGALYLDGGMSAVQEFIEPILENTAHQIVEEHRDQDPKSVLQEWSQGQGLGTPYYQTVGSMGPDHDKVFDVQVMIDGKPYGHGTGHSKAIAAKAAARDAIKYIGLI